MMDRDQQPLAAIRKIHPYRAQQEARRQRQTFLRRRRQHGDLRRIANVCTNPQQFRRSRRSALLRLPLSVDLPEPHAQRIVVIHNRRERTSQRLPVHPCLRDQQHRLVPVIPVADFLAEKAGLNRQQMTHAGCRLAIGRCLRARMLFLCSGCCRDGGDRRQSCHGLLSEDLLRSQADAALAQTRDDLQAEN